LQSAKRETADAMESGGFQQPGETELILVDDVLLILKCDDIVDELLEDSRAESARLERKKVALEMPAPDVVLSQPNEIGPAVGQASHQLGEGGIIGRPHHVVIERVKLFRAEQLGRQRETMSPVRKRVALGLAQKHPCENPAQLGPAD